MEPTTEEPTELAKAIAKVPRRQQTFEVSNIFGLGGKALPKMTIRVATSEEDEQALVARHARMESMEAGAKNDERLAIAIESREIIQRTCLTANGKRQAFGGHDWLKEHLTSDQTGYLMALINTVRDKFSPQSADFTSATVDSIISLCLRASGTDIPERVLLGYRKDYLASLLVYLCVRLWNAERQLDGEPNVDVERGADGTFTLVYAEGDEPDFKPLPEGALVDPDDEPDVADALPEEDEET